jgi:regulator of protease activity HflC (stomatin/prohibitin superfamily)
MLIAITSLLLFVIGLIWLRKPQVLSGRMPAFIRSRFFAFAYMLAGLFGLASLSWVVVDADETGHLKRVYLASELPQGQIVARNGELGPQAQILGPGFHVVPLIRLLYDVEYLPIIEIPEGAYGFLVAKDGAPLRKDQFIADEWPESLDRMLDAEYFLKNAGQKGPQLTVLPPGKYRFNRYLFETKLFEALDVPTGHVAVIRSNVATRVDCPSAIRTAGGEPDASLSAPIVPKGCIGVWDEPLPPGRYYLNDRAFVPTIIPTRVQVWTYKGGYKERNVKLTLAEDGSIRQAFDERDMPMPQSAADRAINVRVEGWTFPVEMRVVVQVHPENAPKVVAAVGDLQRVEDAIITPTIRDAMRTIGGDPSRKVMDFVEERDALMEELETVLIPEGLKAGVTIQEARMGEPSLPPELMVARLRRQLASQMRETYEEEKKAQQERITVKREQATADQQPVLVAAEIQKQAAEHRKEQLRLEGEGEKLRLMEIAQGQEAQKSVLGSDRVYALQVLKEVLTVAATNPDIIKVPVVSVRGIEGSSLEGAAAVLGASNFTNLLRNTSPPRTQQSQQ